jgi:hypothetical protein
VPMNLRPLGSAALNSPTSTPAAPPALAVSPSTLSVGATLTLFLTGTNTNWTGATTFTASAGLVGTVSVGSATSAALTFTAPASPGAVTITDTTTGRTATLVVASPRQHQLWDSKGLAVRPHRTPWAKKASKGRSVPRW